MGLLDMMGLGDTRFGQAVANNRSALGAFGAGLAGGTNLGEGLALATKNMYLARALDDERSKERSDEQKRQAQINQTQAWIQRLAASNPNNPLIAQYAQGLQTGAIDAPTAFKGVMESMQPSSDLTTDQRNYAAAQGDPNFGAFLTNNAMLEGGVSTMGPIKPGWEAYRGDDGQWHQRPVQGGPEWLDAQNAATAGDRKLTMAVEGANTILSSLNDAETILNRGSYMNPVSGTGSKLFSWNSDTDAGLFRGTVRALQSGIGVGKLQALKEASATGATGFGQLNKSELQLLLDELGALDADQNPQILKATFNRIRARYTRVIEDIQRNVSPERQRELGLDQLIAETAAMTNGPPTDLQSLSDQQLLEELYRRR